MRDWLVIGRPSMRQIAAAVAQDHGLLVSDLYTLSRQKWLSHPRQEAMARMSWAGFSHTQIVRHFGLKDHTTSLHARRAVEARGLDYRVPKSKWTRAVKAKARARSTEGVAA
jgi:chromosomal replication initiation ATPase DnaA